jgi:RNA polymerase sigma-70 factor (ECF subfamily)
MEQSGPTISLAGFAGRSSAKTWAFSIATRVAADYLRRLDRSIQIVEVDEATQRSDGLTPHW